MLKATEKLDKLKHAIIVSVVLHIILIALLVWSSFDSSMDASGGDGVGLAIDSVMVDPNDVVEQYNRQQQQQSDAKRAEQLRKKQVAKQQAKAAADAKKKAEKEVKKQAATAAAAKKQAKKKAKAKAVANAKSDVEAKTKAAADKKAATESAAQSDSVDDLIGGLASSKNVPKSGASSVALDSYGGQVRVVIQNKFYNWQLYRGKTCTLRIKLAPDGILVSVKAESGDPALCQAAIAAAKQARIPKPPSTDVYEAFKNAPIDFKPQ
ncbi:MAG: cell envelope integrity protein TolA [Candidatus Malihini olakiniferum]